MNIITQEQLKKLLKYDSKTGFFTWIVSRKGVNLGQPAGIIDNDSGYRKIRVNGKQYRASRLAWLYMEGYFPEHEVDHRDRIKHNDKWKNLRHATRQCNSRTQA